MYSSLYLYTITSYIVAVASVCKAKLLLHFLSPSPDLRAQPSHDSEIDPEGIYKCNMLKPLLHMHAICTMISSVR